MNDTKSKILESALRILNTGGLSALSIRAVAEDLNLSPGNVSYHFKRKESLVFALSQELGGRNADQFARRPDTVREFVELLRDTFRHQHRYAGLVLALPDIMETFERVRSDYGESQTRRRTALHATLMHLAVEDELNLEALQRTLLVSHITLIARFWLAEARVSYGHHSLDQIIDHYLALIADTLMPHASIKSRKELEPYLEGCITLDSQPQRE